MKQIEAICWKLWLFEGWRPAGPAAEAGQFLKPFCVFEVFDYTEDPKARGLERAEPPLLEMPHLFCHMFLTAYGTYLYAEHTKSGFMQAQLPQLLLFWW
ncbi:hypothetical protein MHYP_G00229570 [Metynnis hypsauchen]